VKKLKCIKFRGKNQGYFQGQGQRCHMSQE